MIHGLSVLVSVDFDELVNDMDFLQKKADETQDVVEADRFMRIRSLLVDVHTLASPLSAELKKAKLSASPFKSVRLGVPQE